MLFLWQNNARPILPLFGLIVSLVRLIITAVEHIFPLVLIAPLQVCRSSFHTINIVLIALLQSPWSSVTQGPFVLCISNKKYLPLVLQMYELMWMWYYETVRTHGW